MFQDIAAAVEAAFEKIGISKDLARTLPSGRPDLSDIQCNGALQAAKILKCPPRQIAEEIKKILETCPEFSNITVDGPGFLNFRLSDSLILKKLASLVANDCRHTTETPEKFIIDYGGPNVAKPLHVGHLRSAIIGESIKRTGRMLGHEVISDIHLGDWGTPMGMLLADLEESHPEWPHFASNYVEDPCHKDTVLLTGDELNVLYPKAAKRFKEDEDFKNRARKATEKLQEGHPGYRALWRHFVDLSLESIKNDFGYLGVDFDMWLGESDADPYIASVIEDMGTKGLLRESEGAVVTDVARENDSHDIPPMILRKTGGAVTYAATDLATIFQRVRDFAPDHILYVVDQRQSSHFQQVFRAAAKAGYIAEERLEHIGFGTMNGPDGKPYKTRSGGVMRLSDLIRMALGLAQEAAGFVEADFDIARAQMIQDVAIGAIKYGDLRNPRTSDYAFDPVQLVNFEGNTGPYIQYAAVRARAILDKGGWTSRTINPESGFSSKTERDLALKLVQYPGALEGAFARRLPSDLCGYVYDLSKTFSGFYADCAVLSEENAALRDQRLALTAATYKIITNILHALAIPAPEKMLRADKRAAPAP